MSRSPHERSDMRGPLSSMDGPGYRYAHPGYGTGPNARAISSIRSNVWSGFCARNAAGAA